MPWGEWHAAGAGVSGNGKIREVTLSFQGDLRSVFNLLSINGVNISEWDNN